MSNAKLVNAVIVFMTPNVERTAEYYHGVLGFRVVDHFDKGVGLIKYKDVFFREANEALESRD